MELNETSVTFVWYFCELELLYFIKALQNCVQMKYFSADVSRF
jgi:hypothetical protein